MNRPAFPENRIVREDGRVFVPTKLGLTYLQEPSTPYRPLNAEAIRAFRPDVLRLPVTTLTELLHRCRQAAVLKVPILPVFPIADWSPRACEIRAPKITAARW